MKLYRRKFRPSLIVPALFVLYAAIIVLTPSPFAAILLGLAVVIAARSWELRGGLIAALAAAPAMGLGYWTLSRSALVQSLPLRPVALEWMSLWYIMLWLAVTALAVFVGYLTRQTHQLDRLNADLRHAQQRLTALHKIAISLSTTLDVGRLLETILEQLGYLWGYDHGAILLVDETSGELVVTASRGYSEGPGHRFPADAGISGAVVRSGQPLFVPDVANDPRYILGVRGARSELAVPLVWEGKTLGVLNVESRMPNAYGQSDLDLLATVAEQAAAAIGNARLHQKTRDLAITDPHTGLFNYRHFQEQVAATVREAQLTGNACTLLMLDLDFFKRVNDTYGHPTGDSVLQQVARLLREQCRQEDQVFRYGGEEFAILLPEADDDAALRVGERIREKMAAHAFTTRSGRRLDFGLTVSLGVASYPRDATSDVDLLLAADTALYAAKSGGRNRVATARQGVTATTA